MIEAIKDAVTIAWSLLFSMGETAVVGTGDDKETFTVGKGIVVLFMGFLAQNPVLLLPVGFYLIIMGIKSTRKLVTGY
jgi:hypothetical protein